MNAETTRCERAPTVESTSVYDLDPTYIRPIVVIRKRTSHEWWLATGMMEIAAMLTLLNVYVAG